MFARRVGNVLQAFSCIRRVAPIIEMDLFLQRFLSGWMGVFSSLVLKVHRVQELCNDVLPLMVRTVESWVEINS